MTVELSNIYPLVPLRDIVMFPGMVAPLFVGRQKSVAALEKALQDQSLIVLGPAGRNSRKRPSLL